MKKFNNFAEKLEKNILKDKIRNMGNWKKYAKNEWTKEGEKYTYAKVWKTGLPLKEMKRRGYIGTYGFSARIGREGQTTKEYFKKKSEAIKRAEKYMNTFN